MINDSQLQQAVQDELKWEPRVTAAHIGVTAHAGVVTLTGHVETYPEKQAAERAATRVKGVKGVAEELEVRLPFETKRSDEAIAAAAIERLSWDVSVPKDSLQVKVEKGWVTLSGQVDHYFQKHAPEQDIRPLIGVIGVSNQITIKAQPHADAITNNIMHALHRSWLFDPNTIQVSGTDGRVKLSGTAASAHDKAVAASTAWMALGVTSVENILAIV